MTARLAALQSLYCLCLSVQGLLAKSCLCPGFATLVSNLITSSNIEAQVKTITLAYRCCQLCGKRLYAEITYREMDSRRSTWRHGCLNMSRSFRTTAFIEQTCSNYLTKWKMQINQTNVYYIARTLNFSIASTQGCGKEVYRAKLSRTFEGRTFGQVCLGHYMIRHTPASQVLHQVYALPFRNLKLQV